MVPPSSIQPSFIPQCRGDFLKMQTSSCHLLNTLTASVSPVKLHGQEPSSTTDLFFYLVLHIHTYTWSCVHTCTYLHVITTHKYAHAWKHMSMNTYSHTCTHSIHVIMQSIQAHKIGIHMHTFMDTHTCIYVHRHTHTNINNMLMNTYIGIDMFPCINMYSLGHTWINTYSHAHN